MKIHQHEVHIKESVQNHPKMRAKMRMRMLMRREGTTMQRLISMRRVKIK